MSGEGQHHTLTLWTNDAERAAWADRAGVDRIGLDLETLGKAERQGGLATWRSSHRIEDLERLRPVIGAPLFVRANPLNEGSAWEVDALVKAGARIIMLPNFTRAAEIEAFVRIVGGRARIVPLLERTDALGTIAALPALGVNEIHIGLNDLSIDLGLKNRVAVLSAPIMDRIADAARQAGLVLGVGGLGRALDTALPVPSDLVYAAQARLGSTGSLLARSFFAPGMDERAFAAEIGRLRARLDEWRAASPGELEAARLALLRYAETSP